MRHGAADEVRSCNVQQDGVRHRPVGDPQFRAVEDVVVAVAHGARRHGADGVAARARLAHAERADRRAVAQRGQKAAALILRAVEIDVVRAEVIVRGVRNTQAVVRIAQLLADQAGREEVEANAAVLGRNREPEVTLLAELRPDMRRPPVFVVHPSEERVKLGHEILARALLQADRFLRKVAERGGRAHRRHFARRESIGGER